MSDNKAIPWTASTSKRSKRKLTLKNHNFANLDEAAKLCKASNDAYNRGGWVA